MGLRRYWFEFETEIDDEHPAEVLPGCGVTAYDRVDAEKLLRDRVFRGLDMPKIKKCIEDVDVSSLDPNHVLPNMGLVTKRGIWFPLGYTHEGETMSAMR